MNQRRRHLIWRWVIHTPWVLVVLAVLMSVVSVYYYVRVLVPVWSPTARSDDLRVPLSTTAAIAISGVASILLGLYPTLILLESQVGVVPIAGR